MSLEMQAQDEHPSGLQQVKDSEIIALASVDYESASRLEYDRRQRSSIRNDKSVHPDRADQEFMAGLLPLLRKVPPGCSSDLRLYVTKFAPQDETEQLCIPLLSGWDTIWPYVIPAMSC